MAILEIALALTAIYCGGWWLWLAVRSWPLREAYRNDAAARAELQAVTFHLGLCFILAAGFLGLLVE